MESACRSRRARASLRLALASVLLVASSALVPDLLGAGVGKDEYAAEYYRNYGASDGSVYDGGWNPWFGSDGRLTSSVGWRRDPLDRRRWQYHDGWDIAMPSGWPVSPSAAGYVIHAGRYGKYGLLVAVDHMNGYVSMYGHLSAVLARVGDYVDTRSVVGNVGSTGRATGPHLHYEIRARTGG